MFVRPFADPDAPGTEISARRTLDEYPVKALSAIAGQALITVAGNGMLGVPGIAARTFETLHQRGHQRVADHPVVVGAVDLLYGARKRGKRRARAPGRAEFRDEIARKEIDGVQVQTGLATVAVVGLGMAGHPGIAVAGVQRRWPRRGINIVAIAQGSSELNISFVVAAKDAAAAQRAVHDAFQLAKIGGGAATRAAAQRRGAAGLRADRPHAGRHACAKAAARRTAARRQQAAAGRRRSTAAASCSIPAA